jgi:hypothetical protein
MSSAKPIEQSAPTGGPDFQLAKAYTPADAERFDVSDRGRINEALWESVSKEKARCVRITVGKNTLLLTTVVLYDQSSEPSGGAALVLPPCDRSRVLQVVAQREGVLGYLSLLLDGGGRGQQAIAERPDMGAAQPAAGEVDELDLADAGLLDRRVEQTLDGVVVADHGAIADGLRRHLDHDQRGLVGTVDLLREFVPEEEPGNAADAEQPGDRVEGQNAYDDRSRQDAI